MKFLSMNICGLTEEKLSQVKSDFDVMFFQEIKSTKSFNLDGYIFYPNPGPYAGTCIFIKKEINHQCQTIIHGRMQELIIDGVSYFNNYHKRVATDRKRLDERINYDQMFLKVFPRRDRCVLLGDMNSVLRFHDSAKNLSIKEDLERSKFDWTPDKEIDEKKACYERQFMNFFVKEYDFKDRHSEKGPEFTFYKGNKPCMRIDYCLTKSVEVKSLSIEKRGVSDHCLMVVDF